MTRRESLAIAAALAAMAPLMIEAGAVAPPGADAARAAAARQSADPHRCPSLAELVVVVPRLAACPGGRPSVRLMSGTLSPASTQRTFRVVLDRREGMASPSRSELRPLRRLTGETF